MNRFKTLLIFVVIVGLSACDVLDEQPQQSLPVEGGLDTVAELENALTGAYDDVQSLEGTSFAQVLFTNDIIAENAFWTGSFPTLQEISNQQMTAGNGSIEDHWNGAYVAINDANIIIDRLSQLEEGDQATIDNIRGQALFIRALQYYYLTQHFAKPWGATSDNSHMGVPLQLDAVTSSDDFNNEITRASVNEVYNQILTDLEEADDLITNTTPNRATADAAVALQARIALIQERWTDAADLADQVIGNFELEESVTTYFTDELSSESIYEIQNTVQDVPDPANTSITAVYHPDTRDDIQISDEYATDLEQIITEDQEAAVSAAGLTATDTRISQLLTGTDSPDDVAQATDADNTLKYESFINADDNLPVLRLSEMILTRAEALAEANGVNQESIDLLNQIRTRAITVTDADGNAGDESLIEYTTGDFQSADELIDAILLEREVELAFEGHRKTDLQRREMDVQGTAWDADILTFPIPQSQIDANDAITQNPGYEEN